MQQLMRGPVSGDALARASGQTRAAIWKRVEALRKAGVPIQARPGSGYSLSQPLELLDAGAITDALPPAARARIATLDIAWSLDSTNSELLRRRPAGDGMAQVLLAECQTGGRGRRGRRWQSPLAAHVYLSLARSFDGGLARLGGLSLVAGIASAEALHALGFAGVRLKWPNDLVVVDEGGVDGGGLRKLGGLLVEGGGEHAGPARAVIGLGLNVCMPDAAAARIDQPWCDLAGLAAADARRPPSRNDVAAALLAHWLPVLEAFDADGLAPLLPRYAALDALAGQRVDVRTESAPGEGRVQAGVVVGLAEDGGLRLRLASGDQRVVYAGEVHVGKSHAGKPGGALTGAGEVSVRRAEPGDHAAGATR